MNRTCNNQVFRGLNLRFIVVHGFSSFIQVLPNKAFMCVINVTNIEKNRIQNV